jgi:hypothetical protein
MAKSYLSLVVVAAAGSVSFYVGLDGWTVAEGYQAEGYQVVARQQQIY